MFQKSDKRTYIDTYWKKKIYRFQRPPNREYINEKGGLDDDDDHLIYKFKLKMANTLSVMTNVLRNVVSKQRIRYKENGFDLDLAYINENIIAMGYPADKLESIYRNRLEDVYKFLEENHQDHYKIYNLCLERSYDKNKFHGRVAVYPFEDHNPPTIELIEKFCNDVDTWLKADVKNVAAVHCKAGKGRTGTMICCYLLYSGQYATAEDALAFYDSKRTKDRKGVTIPSQRRYVQYFSKLLRSGLPYEKRTLQFCEIRFTEAHVLHNQGSVNCSVSVLQDRSCAVEVETLRNLCIDFRKSFILDLRNCGLDVTGDIKVELTSKLSRKKIFHFWVNTYFIANAAEIDGEGDDAKYVYTLNKCEIDDVHKDKEHKSYSEDFKVQLVFYVNAINRHHHQNTTTAANAIAGNRTSSSSAYELSHVQMGGRHFMSHNSYPLTTGVSAAAIPPSTMGMTTQLNSSGSNLSYNCDQRSSSSSASVSSLVGGGVSGGGVSGGGGSGSDSTKLGVNKFTNEQRLKMNSNGNAADLKMQQFQQTQRNHFIDDLGTETATLLQSTQANYNNFSTANNVALKQKLLRQQQDVNQQQQQQKQPEQQYQPSENNVAAAAVVAAVVLPPSKFSRGNRSSNTKQLSNNHITNNHYMGYDVGYVSGKIANNISSHSTNNGIDISKNEHAHHHYNNQDVDDDDGVDDGDVDDEVDDDDVAEDWESGESTAISLPHYKAPTINTNTSTTTINTTITTTFHKTTLNNSLTASLTPSNTTATTRNTATLTTRTTTTTNNNNMSYYHPHKTSNTQQQQKQQELTSLPSMNLETFTNISTSSSCSLHSKAEIGGENVGNDCIRNIINDTDDDDNDNNDDQGGDDDKRKVLQTILDHPKSNVVPAIVKQNCKRQDSQESTSTATAAASAIVPPTSSTTTTTSRNKFFPFTLTKTHRIPITVSDNNSTVTVYNNTTQTPKQPFFRRKSFKTVNNAICGDSNTANVDTDLPTTTAASLGVAGLAPTSKQTLKIKLKKNRFKLAQKFQKLQNFLRNDPDDFRKTFVQQTKVRRNSACSLTYRNQKAQTTNSNININTLSTSPGSNLQSCVKQTPPKLEQQLSTESVLNIFATATPPTTTGAAAAATTNTTHSCSSLSPSASASNASLGSSADCDLGCDCDDYYSSICDNQLSFDNSPCKSPRSLADIALMSGGRHMDSAASSYNAANSLTRFQQHQHFLQQHHHNHNHKRLPFLTSGNRCGAGAGVVVNTRLLKEQQKQQTKNVETSGSVVVVAAKPAKTHAIGFNVMSAASQNVDVVENVAANDVTVNGFEIDENNLIAENERTSAYFTPPTSEPIQQQQQHENFKATNTPFIFPTMLCELDNISENVAQANTTPTTTTSNSKPALNLLILKNNDSNNIIDDNTADVCTYINKNNNTKKTPSTDEASLESIENLYENSAASISNGNNTAGTAGTNTSSSGFSNSDCCCTNDDDSNVVAVCNCNPLQFDLERYAARNQSLATNTNIEASNFVNEESIVEKQTAESINN